MVELTAIQDEMVRENIRQALLDAKAIRVEPRNEAESDFSLNVIVPQLRAFYGEAGGGDLRMVFEPSRFGLPDAIKLVPVDDPGHNLIW